MLYGVVVVCTDGGVVCAGVKVLHARVSGVSLSVFMVLLFALVFGCCPSA